MKEDHFKVLKQRLAEEAWPEYYMYKFILPADNKKIAQVHALFDETANVTIRPSSEGNYVSITVKEVAVSAEEVIYKYEAASEIEGVRAL